MGNKITKKEIKDWVNFLYEDLLEHRVFVGGYYFTFDQIDTFKSKKKVMDDKIRRVNKNLGVMDTLLNKPLLNRQRMALELESKKFIDDTISDKIKAINKYSEEVTIPVDYKDFTYILEQLEYIKEEIECFKDFIYEEIKELKSGDEGSLMQFINDFINDLKDQLSGDIVIQRVRFNVPDTKKILK